MSREKEGKSNIDLHSELQNQVFFQQASLATRTDLLEVINLYPQTMEVVAQLLHDYGVIPIRVTFRRRGGCRQINISFCGLDQQSVKTGSVRISVDGKTPDFVMAIARLPLTNLITA